MVVVAPVAGRSIEPLTIVEYLHARLPRQYGSYVRIVKELPKTPTEKVQKHVLREQGITADT